MACSGTTMSENRIAASTPYRRTGCRVSSADSGASAMAVRMEPAPRAALYSGRARPAWRMNQTGVRVTGSRTQARTRFVRASAVGLTRGAL